MALRLPSAGQRFLRTLAFSLLQAAIFGSAVGLLVYFRPAPTEWVEGADEPHRLGAGLPRWLEGWEARTFDWRARELSGRLSPPATVRWMPVDGETLAYVRGEPHPDVAGRPWSRAFLGKVVRRLGEEGANLVLLDLPLADASPRPRDADVTPDEQLRDALGAVSLPTVVGFDVSSDSPPMVGERLRPLLLWVASHPSPAESRPDLLRVLSERRSAFLIPASGGYQVWAGVEDEADARSLGRRLWLRGPLVFREFSAKEQKDQVRPVDLLLEKAEVQVEGLDASRLLAVRTLEPPVAPLLGGRPSLGSFAMPRGPDGVVRGMPLLIAYARESGEVHLLPSAPLAAAMELAGTRKLRYANGRLMIGDRFSVPMDASGFAFLAWEGMGPRTLSAWRLLVNLLDALAGSPPHYPLDLGRSAVVFSDEIPAQRTVRTALEARAPRGLVLAQALSNILTSRALQRSSPRWDVTATFILAFAGAFLALSLRGFLRSGFGVIIYVGLLVAAGATYWFFAQGLFHTELRWVAVAGPLLALTARCISTTAYAVRTDREVSDFITQVLGRYVSPDVARQVFRNVSLMRPERRDVTVMFSDMEGFGRLSERLAPEQIAELLHEWLTEVTTRVHERGGQVDYAGDSVMAFWGAPVRHANHAERACACALGVQAALARSQEIWEKRYGQRVEFRTGITTGAALAGDLGSAFKSNYTVLGEVVSAATLLERLNHRFRTSILVSQATVERSARQFVFREVERVQLPGGRVESVYELLAAQRDFTPERRTQLTRFEEALALFRTRRFDEATLAFQALGSDPVALLYADRSRALLATPPPPDWDATGALSAEAEATG